MDPLWPPNAPEGRKVYRNSQGFQSQTVSLEPFFPLCLVIKGPLLGFTQKCVFFALDNLTSPELRWLARVYLSQTVTF